MGLFTIYCHSPGGDTTEALAGTALRHFTFWISPFTQRKH